MEDKMKIDISSLIGDLVEDTIRSINKEKSSTLSEKIRAYSGGQPKTNTKKEKTKRPKNRPESMFFNEN